MVSKKHDHRFSWSPQYAAKKIIQVFYFIQPVGSVFTVNLNSNILNYIAEHLKEIWQSHRGPMSNPMKFTSGWLSWGIITLSWILTIGGLYKKHVLICNAQINADNILQSFHAPKFLKKLLVSVLWKCPSWTHALDTCLGHMPWSRVCLGKVIFKRSMTAHFEMSVSEGCLKYVIDCSN